ncbi:MAG: hypothetical protein RBR97_17395 [Bacteroidales bacterium]|nr:hypothetical protein [Bacteroidales bacterium]
MKLTKLTIILILAVSIQACKSPELIQKTIYVHDTVIVHNIVADTVKDSAIIIRDNIVHDTVLIVQTRWAKAEASLQGGELSVQLIQKDTIIYDTIRVETQTNINTVENKNNITTKNVIFVIISTFLFIIAVLLLIKKLIK